MQESKPLMYSQDVGLRVGGMHCPDVLLQNGGRASPMVARQPILGHRRDGSKDLRTQIYWHLPALSIFQIPNFPNNINTNQHGAHQADGT